MTKKELIEYYEKKNSYDILVKYCQKINHLTYLDYHSVYKPQSLLNLPSHL